MKSGERVKVKGQTYVPVVGVVRQKAADGRPILVELVRDDDVIDLRRDPAREFLVLLGSEAVFKK